MGSAVPAISRIIYATDFVGKICSKCDALKSQDEFYKQVGSPLDRRPECKACVKKYNDQQSYRQGPHRHRSGLKYRFGLTPEQYNEMLTSQGGVCKICKRTNPDGTRLAVDHDEETKEVRGLLCTQCNLGIGNLKHDVDILQSAIDYIKHSRTGLFVKSRG